jgi:heme exporter protein A
LLFAGLSFDLHAGEALAITGRNGAGKTSLIRIIAGLLRPGAGSIALTPTRPSASAATWSGPAKR